MKEIVIEFFGTTEASTFLQVLPHHYYEENLIHFLLISKIKDFDECVKEVEKFLPYINCWPVCDQSTPLVFNKNDDFREEYLEWVSSKSGNDYYLKMMVAWFFATALAKQYNKTIKYIENRCLDPWIHQKTIQKEIESYRVSNEHKEYLKKFR